MNRNTRTLIVVLVALVAASAAAWGTLQAIRSIPVRQVEVAHTYVVAAAHTIPTGARLTPADVKLIPWPERAQVPGSFTKVEAVVDRGVLSQVFENEPITESKLASLEGGAGLPPTIPPGMRAISVRVNEVVGVAGFVTPGTKVDVFVTLKQGVDDATRVVVSNVQVLTAGTRYDQDKAKDGQAIPSSVVTLLLTPEDASRVVLASNEGQIMLALRNPLDTEITNKVGTRAANLFNELPAPAPRVQPRPKVAEKPVVAPPPPPPAPPKRYSVEAIRAAKRSEEVIK
jgi:pilus assembly protein CpaB